MKTVNEKKNSYIPFKAEHAERVAGVTKAAEDATAKRRKAKKVFMIVAAVAFIFASCWLDFNELCTPDTLFYEDGPMD